MPGQTFWQFTAIDGGLGVDVFFIISGFIMYYVSATDFGRPGAARDFIVRRFLRVAPLYYLATTLLLIVILTAGENVDSGTLSWAQIVAAYLFLPWLNAMGEAVPILKLGWTLNYEAYFYILFAFALLFVRKAGILFLCAAVTTIVVMASVLHARTIPQIDVWGDPIVFEFLAGVGIAALYRRGRRLQAGAAWGLVGAGLLLVIALRLTGIRPLVPRAIFNGLPATVLVSGVVLGPMGQKKGWWMRALEIGGDASYALYLFHPFAIRAATVGWTVMHGPQNPWLLITVIIVVALTAAVGINLAIEKPFDRFLRKHLRRRIAPLQSTI